MRPPEMDSSVTSSRARPTVLALGLACQVLTTIVWIHGEASRLETMLLTAVGIVVWSVPAVASPTKSFRWVTGPWILVCVLGTFWLLPGTALALGAALMAFGTRLPRRDVTTRVLGATAAGVFAAVTAYVLVVVPTPPSDIHVCLRSEGDPTWANRVFEVAYPGGDATGTRVAGVTRASDDEVVVTFEPWATRGDVNRVVIGVTNFSAVTTASTADC